MTFRLHLEAFMPYFILFVENVEFLHKSNSLRNSVETASTPRYLLSECVAQSLWTREN